MFNEKRYSTNQTKSKSVIICLVELYYISVKFIYFELVVLQYICEDIFLLLVEIICLLLRFLYISSYFHKLEINSLTLSL